MAGLPEVSVVIPTRFRVPLLTRAVRSVLAQTLQEFEVIVVVDGPDDETRLALAAFGDDRIRTVELPEGCGAPVARNTGVRQARADWVALLDDDDEWHPEKLAVQLALARASRHATPIVACHLVLKTPRADLVLPRRMPAKGEPISEYLTVRHGPFHGEGFVQTSMIMTRTEHLRAVPFTEGLRRFHELDWMLRSHAVDGVGLEIAPESLVTWHADENRPRISQDSPARETLEWMIRVRPLVTRRAYAALAMSIVSSTVAPSRSPRLFVKLVREALRHGQPNRWDYLAFIQVWCLPSGVRRRVRDRILGRRSMRSAAAGSTARTA